MFSGSPVRRRLMIASTVSSRQRLKLRRICSISSGVGSVGMAANRSSTTNCGAGQGVLDPGLDAQLDPVAGPQCELRLQGHPMSGHLSLIHISEPTRLLSISYAVF